MFYDFAQARDLARKLLMGLAMRFTSQNRKMKEVINQTSIFAFQSLII